MDEDTTDKACELVIENHPDTQPILEADVEVENGTEVQQLTSSNNRKCLQRPSKSCCVIIGILALFCILLGVTIFAIYEGIVPGDILFPVMQPVGC